MTHSKDTILIGKGYWGPNLARNLNALGRLGMIVDANPKVVEDSQREYPQVLSTTDLSSALQNSKMTAVFIATPPHTHANLAISAMRAGKDVFVEKPMADHLDQAKLMQEVARETGRILMVGHILLYHPAVVKLKAMIQSGELGKLQYLYSNRLNFGQIRIQENTMWSFAPHDIAVINYLLGETPSQVSTSGSDHVTAGIHDVTLTDLDYPSGIRAHIFVSWLHPFKEQKLVVIGTKKMAVFSDVESDKLVTYDHQIEWLDRRPIPKKADARAVEIGSWEPLRKECEAFFEAVKTRCPPLSDDRNGYHVVEVLQASDQSLKLGGKKIAIHGKQDSLPYFFHETACVDEGAVVGRGSKIWHFSHVLKGAKVGEFCILGQNVNIGEGAEVGNRVKIQNNVSIYGGTTIEDEVFLGPSCVLTNISNPRSQINRHQLYEKTMIRKGASIGANATILCGIEIGRYAFIAAGAVVTKDVPDYALMMGNPARQKGWMSRHGHQLVDQDIQKNWICPESGFRYKKNSDGKLICLDLDEEAPLPESAQKGVKSYQELKWLGASANVKGKKEDDVVESSLV